jgi:hypothetical protein
MSMVEVKEYIRKIDSYLVSWVTLLVLFFLLLFLGDSFKSIIVWIFVGIADALLFIIMAFISYRLFKVKWEYYGYLKQQFKNVWKLSRRKEPPDLK